MTIRNQHIIISLRHSVFKIAIFMLLSVLTTATAMGAPRKSKGKTKVETQFTLVIDAGHGGHDHGAIDNGAKEKDINLGVALKLANNIKKRLKNVNVVMTRDDDTFISLQERANIANRNKGNLFVSIHTNSVDKKNPNRKTVSGTSVYALGPQKDANNLRVAQRENSVIELEDNYHQKYSGFDPSKDESYIIFEMAQKKNLGQSLKFAEKAQKELVSTAKRKDRGVKQAGFWVLWATAMPSVLVELDFICNPTEAAFISSQAGQQKMADALTNAVEKYIAAQNNPEFEKASQAALLAMEQEKGDEMAQANQQDDSDSVRTLVTKSDKTKKRVHKAKSKNNTGTYSRRRRSETSKQKSDNRSLEADEIALTSEESYLAVSDNKKGKDEVISIEKENSDKESVKKNKKKKKKDNKKDKKKESNKKEIKDSKTKSNKVEAKKKSGNNNPKQKTYVVKKSSGKLEARNKTQASSGSAELSFGSQASSATSMEYTIILLSSEREVKTDDPRFGGLVPGGSFKENGLYKYTYGRSTSRKEIEKLLLDVKSVLPDAYIVVRMR